MRRTAGIAGAFVALAWLAQPSLADFTQQGPKLIGSGAVGTANQGASLALSADGTTAIVGGTGDNGGAGAAWVFVGGPPLRPARVWIPRGCRARRLAWVET